MFQQLPRDVLDLSAMRRHKVMKDKSAKAETAETVERVLINPAINNQNLGILGELLFDIQALIFTSYLNYQNAMNLTICGRSMFNVVVTAIDRATDEQKQKWVEELQGQQIKKLLRITALNDPFHFNKLRYYQNLSLFSGIKRHASISSRANQVNLFLYEIIPVLAYSIYTGLRVKGVFQLPCDQRIAVVNDHYYYQLDIEQLFAEHGHTALTRTIRATLFADCPGSDGIVSLLITLIVMPFVYHHFSQQIYSC